jgi:DNA-binding response OmpR family regulator
VRASIARTLQAEGVLARLASDGDGAIAALEDAAFVCDLMCIDGVIPGAGSAQVIARACAKTPRPAILVCSGYVEEELVRRGVQAGEYALLRKPFSPAELLEQVRTLISVGQGAPS